MPPVTVRVPAKVNLQLAVGARRSDGYHELVTVFHAVDLVDDLRVEVAEPGSGPSLQVSGEGAEQVPLDASNLAWQAAVLVAEMLKVPADVAMHLTKAIPVAGGMAGGSADAAAALVACLELWGGHLDRGALDGLAARLGSDVPFALHGGTAIGTGRGELLTPALVRGEFHWVFAIAPEGLSTPAVYAECDRLRGDEKVPVPQVDESLMQALASGDALALGGALSNDLQAAAVSLRPTLGRVIDTGLELGALGGVVSGSGPTCAFLVPDDARGLDIAVGLMSTGLCRTVKRGVGPAPGARLVAPR